MRLRKNVLISAGAAALVTFGANVASAQSIIPAGDASGGMDTHLFRSAVDSKGFFYVNGTDIIGHTDFSFGMGLDWGHTLLRTRDPDAIGTSALIAESFQGVVSANYGLFNFLVVGVSLPINMMTGKDANRFEDGDTDQLDSQKIQAVIPHLKARFLKYQDGFGLSMVTQVGFSVMGAEKDLGAEPGFWYWPRLQAEKAFGAANQFKIAIDAGYQGHTGKNAVIRRDSSGGLALFEGELSYGDQPTWGLGLSYRAIPRLDLVLENYGSYLLAENTAANQKISSEFLGGAKLFVEENSYLMAAGGSRAFFTGFEAADVRVVLGFVYEPSIGDRDGDGLRDDVDACPDDPEDFDNFQDSDGCPEPDNDNDGIPDKKDRCPNVAEDHDGDEDRDGCPEGDKRKDRDGDGIPDDVDKCPDNPEDKDGFEDEDGCPEKDNDGDGILDKEDQCPDDAEDFDKFEDKDGCPEKDNDLDRILDKDDQCPTEPEVYNGFQDGDGCPDKGKVIIDGSDIVILEKIQFATGSDKILPASFPLVDAIVGTLKGHPEFVVLEVAGHADERGSDEMNLDLTKRRAASVRKALVDRGVQDGRLVSQGYGEFCPLDDRSAPAAWDKNRRVDFKVVKTEDGMTGVKRGCEKARAAGLYPPEVK
jgi:outer membrane protein OmpA-like peptidoglycan-associated protein